MLRQRLEERARILYGFAKRMANRVRTLGRRNYFVYRACRAAGVAYPDIPVQAVESYSQCGEDIIIRALLLAKATRDDIDLSTKRFLEIGGNHPFATSATYLLSKSLGMRGVLVEANETLLQALKKGRPDDIIIYGAVQEQNIDRIMFSTSRLNEISSVDRSFVLNWDGGTAGEASWSEVPALRITDLFKMDMNGGEIVYLSIDVEGMDLTLLKDMDFKGYRPWIVQAEPSDHHIQGNSVEIEEFMKSVGYTLIAKTAVNLIFFDETL